MEFDLKWVNIARYELILRLDGALWLTIVFRPLLTPKKANNASFGQWEAHYQNPLYQQKARAHISLQLTRANLWTLVANEKGQRQLLQWMATPPLLEAMIQQMVQGLPIDPQR